MSKSDEYALAVIRAGKDLGVTPRGIVTGLATCMVEAGPTSSRARGPIVMYANRKVPESLSLPHDDIGSDGYSVGIFQQQIVKTANGYWWADTATCMDPYKSAVLFFTRLKARNYDASGNYTVMGQHAQAVQGSAFPDRYAERMSDATTLYNRLTGQIGGTMAYYDSNRSSEFGFGGPRSTAKVRGICIHTTESGKSATANAQTADNVTSYQIRTQSGSYNVMVGVDGKRILQNTDDWIVWATGNQGNNILLHLCFVGNASQTRAEWLAQDKMLRAGATVVKHWADKYGIPLRKVTTASLPGILGHIDTRAWGGTDHTDPGVNFPYDKLIEYAKGSAPAKPVPNLINQAADRAKSWIGKRTVDREVRVPGGKGLFSVWENAHVYFRYGAKAAYPIPHGGLFESYAVHGWEAGELGFPIRDFTKLPDGAVQAFQGGVLYHKDGQEHGFFVKGAIGDQYARMGFEASWLGYPVSNEITADDYGTGSIVQRFENGMLAFSPSGVISIRSK